jgi:hypothetical protein
LNQATATSAAKRATKQMTIDSSSPVTIAPCSWRAS